MSKKKQTRKKQIADDTADDKFLTEANRFADWTERNLIRIVVSCLILALVVAGVLFARSSTERSRSIATTHLTEALDAYRDASDLQESMTSTVPGELAKLAKEALPAFESVISTGASGANLARLYAADLQRRTGAHEKAEGLYKSFLDNTLAHDITRFVALEGAGYAAEEQGKFDVALGYFEQLTKLPGDFYKDYGYKHMARVYELKEDKAKALETYKTLLGELPDSKLKDFADAQIAKLE